MPELPPHLMQKLNVSSVSVVSKWPHRNELVTIALYDCMYVYMYVCMYVCVCMYVSY